MRKDLLKESQFYIIIGFILFIVALIIHSVSNHPLIQDIICFKVMILSIVFFLIGVIIFILGLFKREILRYQPLRGRRKPL